CVPRHARARLGYKVAFESRYRNTYGFSTAESVDEVDEVFANLLISFLQVIDEIHLVYRDDEITDSKEVSDEGVPPCLGHDAISRVDENHSEIGIAGACHQIARVLLVARRVRDDELPLRRGEIAVRDVDRDALF